MEVFEEAALCEEDKQIATMYLLDAVAQEDIAAEIGVTRKTIYRRLQKIIFKVGLAAEKMEREKKRVE